MPPGSLADAGDGRTLVGRLAPVNEWTEIDSVREGNFMELHAPGAFRKTFAENRANIKILLQHGKDPQLGNKPIADPQEFGEDERGAVLPGRTVRRAGPARRGAACMHGLYGSSHTFEVVREDWNPKPKASRTNPNAHPRADHPRGQGLRDRAP